MTIRVRYFSVFRDVSGKAEEHIDVRGVLTVRGLIDELAKRYPQITQYIDEDYMIVLVNGKSVGHDHIINDGDEVAIMPPASGGGGVVDRELDINKIVEEVIRSTVDGGAGGVVIFVGFVKGKVDENNVEELEYEAYEPHATRKISEIVADERKRDGVLFIDVYHRVGRLKPGDHTIYVIAAAVNRHVAFDAARATLERVKDEVPIFKLEKREDGEYWIIGEKRVKRFSIPL